MIDGVATLITKVRESVARGFILSADLSLEPCFIVRQNNSFAHGASLHEARQALLEKLFEDMPEEERIEAFVKEHTSGSLYSNRDYFDWHHKLTGSCEMGRLQFAKDHGIDLDGSMTPEAFICLTEHAFGGGTIRKLKDYYPAAAD